MKTNRSAGTNVTSILDRRQLRASFAPAKPDPVEQAPDMVLLPDMTDMNARRVVETIARALEGY